MIVCNLELESSLCLYVRQNVTVVFLEMTGELITHIAGSSAQYIEP